MQLALYQQARAMGGVFKETSTYARSATTSIRLPIDLLDNLLAPGELQCTKISGCPFVHVLLRNRGSGQKLSKSPG